MKLRVLREYRCRELHYHPGTIEVDAALGEWLLRDSAAFVRCDDGPPAPAPPTVEDRALDAPPVDRMLRRRRARRK